MTLGVRRGSEDSVDGELCGGVGLVSGYGRFQPHGLRRCMLCSCDEEGDVHRDTGAMYSMFS